jgi:hypothetical protein
MRPLCSCARLRRHRFERVGDVHIHHLHITRHVYRREDWSSCWSNPSSDYMERVNHGLTISARLVQLRRWSAARTATGSSTTSATTFPTPGKTTWRKRRRWMLEIMCWEPLPRSSVPGLMRTESGVVRHASGGTCGGAHWRTVDALTPLLARDLAWVDGMCACSLLHTHGALRGETWTRRVGAH